MGLVDYHVLNDRTVTQDYFVSVVIPTYNRCQQLGDAVKSVCEQSYPGPYEVIVVDNHSTDQTKAIVEKCRQLFGDHVRYVWEGRAGYQYACNTGALEAKGDIVAFTDDDAMAAPDWLEQVLYLFDDPSVGIVGGPIYVKWVGTPPEWASQLRIFGHLDYGPKIREVQWPRTIGGANFLVRKSLYIHEGGFNPGTSVEEKLVGDGECGLCRKLAAKGWKTIYTPHAVMHHVQRAEDVTLSRVRHKFAQQGRFLAYTDYKKNQQGIGRLLSHCVKKVGVWIREKCMSYRFLVRKTNPYYIHQTKAAMAFGEMQYYFYAGTRKHFRQMILRDNWISKGF